jgi:hypothetical protein
MRMLYLAMMTMLEPSRAARLAIAKPMPREVPAMNRVLPWRDVWLAFDLAASEQWVGRWSVFCFSIFLGSTH